MNYCPECGAELQPTDAYCSTCGTPLRGSSTRPGDHKRKSEGERNPAGMLELWGFLAIVAGMLGGFAWLPLFWLILAGFILFLMGRFSR